MQPDRIFERRKAKSQAFRLGKPLFMQVPKTAAASVLAGCAAIAIAFSRLTVPAIGYGPIFLIICAFGAWLVGIRYAIMLLLFIGTVEILSGHAISLHGSPAISMIDLAIRVGTALAVILMLGFARAALEFEWRYTRVDPLTGALTRRAFFEIVEAETRPTGFAVLIFAEVKKLTQMNDRFGCEASEAALQRFADRVRKVIRKEDLFARIGGDEFVIFLRVRDRLAADVVAQRLNLVLNLDPQLDETQVKCSFGVLVLPTGSQSIDDELKMAVRLMHQAKRQKLGFVTAAAIRIDGMPKLIPFVPDLDPSGLQRAAVRSGKRHRVTAARERSSTQSGAG